MNMANRIVLNQISYHGKGAIEEIANEAKARRLTKAFVCTDPDLVKFGVTQKVLTVLEKNGLAYELYSNVKPNPTIENVQTGVKAFQASGADYIVSVGGGSAMDTGKAIGIIVNNPEFADVRSLEGTAATKNPAVFTIAVPTTAGTAAEVTINYVITDVEKNRKFVCVDTHDIPVVAVIDPDMMSSMPKGLTAATGMDALTHAVEAYVSTGATPLTDACAEKAIKLVSENLRRAVANGSDIHAREGMCYAQYLAGMAFNNASLGHVHAMAHQLGGFYNLPHGECNAILLPIVEEYNLLAHLDKFINIARMMDENIDGLSKRDAAELAISAIRRLSQDVGIPASITELAKRYGKEVSRSDIPTMVANAQKDACGLTNPRKMTDAAVQQLYEIAC